MKEKIKSSSIVNIFPKELVNNLKDTPFELALNTSIDIETRVEFLLPFLGVPSNLKGYNYIKKALIIVCKDESKLKKVTTFLYPEIAKIYNTIPSRVERSIRHALEICFNRMDPILAKWFFGYSIDPIKGKCTNTEFIARICRLLTGI